MKMKPNCKRMSCLKLLGINIPEDIEITDVYEGGTIEYSTFSDDNTKFRNVVAGVERNNGIPKAITVSGKNAETGKFYTALIFPNGKKTLDSKMNVVETNELKVDICYGKKLSKKELTDLFHPTRQKDTLDESPKI